MASAALGVNVAVLVDASYPTLPATFCPPAATVKVIVAGWTGSLNTAVGVTVGVTLDDAGSGVWLATVGGVTSGGATLVNTGSTQ